MIRWVGVESEWMGFLNWRLDRVVVDKSIVRMDGVM